MHLEAKVKWTQRYSWRPQSSEFVDLIGGNDWSKYQKYLERLNLKAVKHKAVKWEVGGQGSDETLTIIEHEIVGM